jgi:NAD-dependent deacetylase
MKKIVVLTGAGMSAESGIKTFRDADGLWEGYDVMKVASPQGWTADRALVLEFYNQRRRQLLSVEPNAAHYALVELEKAYDVSIITQNIDDLHERAGSKHIVHLHGELRKARSIGYPHLVYDWDGDIKLGDKCERGAQLRPHIVWFGEAVPKIEVAAEITQQADIVIIIGTSMQVYPAAGLVSFAQRAHSIYYVDPRPSINYELAAAGSLNVVEENATTGVKKVVNKLLENYV